MQQQQQDVQDCPARGCWWQKRDVARRVISFLPSNQDVLACDLVCKEWSELKAPLTSPVTMDGRVLQHDPAGPAAAWINRNLCRVHHLIILHTSNKDDDPLLSRLAEASALRTLQVADAATLQRLPVGVGGLQHLTALHFHKCPLLQQLPADLSGLTQLQQLSVRGMPTSLEELPADMTALVDLSDLQLHGCHLMQEVPDLISTLTFLTRLELDMDSDSPELLPTLQLPSHLTRISSGISALSRLQHLTIRGANKLQELPDVFQELCSLEELRLIGLHSMPSLPDSLGSLSSLTCLLIHGASDLQDLPNSIGGLGRLKHLSLAYCHKLMTIPAAIDQLNSLEHLVLGCHGLLDSLPDSLGGLSSLTHLSIETASLVHLPASLGNLGALKELVLNHCHCLQALPDTIGQLLSLQRLVIDTCMHLNTLPDSITQLCALTELVIHNGEAWPVQLPPLPGGIGRLPCLQRLVLTSQYPPDDGMLPDLPSSLAASTTLQELHWGNLRLRQQQQQDQ